MTSTFMELAKRMREGDVVNSTPLKEYFFWREWNDERVFLRTVDTD